MRLYYQPSEEIAPAGQEASQAPHDKQVSAFISYFVSPCEIAPTGQPSAQVPHETHESEITYAIVRSSFVRLVT